MLPRQCPLIGQKNEMLRPERELVLRNAYDDDFVFFFFQLLSYIT